MYEDSLKSFEPQYEDGKRWAAELKRGRASLADERLGRPITATTTDNIEKVH